MLTYRHLTSANNQLNTEFEDIMSQSKHSTWIVALVGIISAIGLSLALTGCNSDKPVAGTDQAAPASVETGQLNNRPSSIPAVCTR
jgi:hypothetical protein